MADAAESLEEIDARISILRENLRELVHQASGYSGAADDERLSRRITEQEAQLDALARRREALAQS